MFKNKKIYITGILLSCLSACTFPADKGNVQQDMHEAASALQNEIIKSVALGLKTAKNTYTAGDQVAVSIEVFNPDMKDISSVSSWLSFDPTKLQAVEIRDEESDFSLSISEDNTFDNETGLISLQRTAGENNGQNHVLSVATVVFEVLSVEQESITTVDFFHYQPDASGRTGIYQVSDNGADNVMQEPDTPALRLMLQPQQKTKTPRVPTSQ
jgi:hypothetical protein